MNVMKLLVVAVLAFVSVCLPQHYCYGQLQDSESEKSVIYLGLMVPYPDPLGRPEFASTYDDGHDLTPASLLAVEQINNRTDILDGYTLRFILSDGGCTVQVRTVYSFARDIVQRDVPLAGIVGPTCGDAAEFLVPLTSDERYPLITLHYGGGQIFLENDFRNSFSVAIPSSVFSDGVFELIVKNNWRRVGVLSKRNDVFYRLQERANNDTDYEIAFTVPITETLIPLDIIRDSFVRIVYLITTPLIIRKFLCLAYHRNMVYPYYQWIFESLLDADIFEIEFLYNGVKYNCSKEDIHVALRGSLNFHYLSQNFSTVSFSGLNYQQEYERYIQLYEEMYNVNSYGGTLWASPIYDATWAFAFALNNSLNELEQRNITFRKEDLARQGEITDIVRRYLLNVSFQGVNGHFEFHKKTRFLTNSDLDVLQFDSNGKSSIIGHYKSQVGELEIIPSANASFILYSFETEDDRIHVGIAVLFLLLACFALAVAIPLQILNIVYRKHKTIKASSPRLNHIVFIGCYLVIAGMVVHTLSTSLVLSIVAESILCNFFPWFCNIGLTLILTTVGLKTWRLYYIFTTIKQRKTVNVNATLTKDRNLCAVVFLLLLVDIIVGIICSAIDPFVATKRSYLQSFEQAVPQIVSGVGCHSVTTLYYASILGLFKGLLLLFSLVLAFLSRKINYKEFETKNIVILVYLLSLIAALGLPVYLIVIINSTNITIHFLVLNTLLFSAVYICLVVLFLPSVSSLLRQKLGKSSISHSSIKLRNSVLATDITTM